MISKNHNYAKFFFKLCDLGMSLNYEPLCVTGFTMLNILPHDCYTVEYLRTLCSTMNDTDDDLNSGDGGGGDGNVVESCSTIGSRFDEIFYGSSPTQVSYNLMVLYSLLMPSRNPLSKESHNFQFHFIKSGCGFKVLELLTRNNFLSSAVDLAKM